MQSIGGERISCSSKTAGLCILDTMRLFRRVDKCKRVLIVVLAVSEEEGEGEGGRAVCILGGDGVKVACDSCL